MPRLNGICCRNLRYISMFNPIIKIETTHKKRRSHILEQEGGQNHGHIGPIMEYSFSSSSQYRPCPFHLPPPWQPQSIPCTPAQTASSTVQQPCDLEPFWKTLDFAAASYASGQCRGDTGPVVPCPQRLHGTLSVPKQSHL
jgi:hypothetical protein